MATRRRIQLELPRLDTSERDFRSALNDRMRRIQSMFDELDFPPAIATVINTITQGTGLCVIQEIPEGAVDGVNLTFYTSHQPSPALIWVQSGGRSMYPFGDYELTAEEGKIDYTAGAQPKSGEEHWVWYFCGDVLPPQASIGTARHFAGAGDSIIYPYNAVYQQLGDVSLGFWIRLSDATLDEAVIMLHNVNSATEADNHSWGAIVSGTTNNWNIRWFHEAGAGIVEGVNEIFVDLSPAIGNNQWRYVGLSRDESAQTIDIYVGDGESIIYTEQQSYSVSPTGGGSANGLVTVGQLTSGESPLFNEFVGDIQEHYVWSRALSQAEHLAAMQQVPSSTGLIMSVGPHLGDSPEIDDSSTGNTGAVTLTSLTDGHVDFI
jgi:hypothetical protein